MTNEPNQSGRRTSDQKGWRGFMCWCAQRASDAWDWIDNRDIDALAVAGVVLWASIDALWWAKSFAETSSRPGADIALILAAILGPWSLVQGAAIKFILEHRRAP